MRHSAIWITTLLKRPEWLLVYLGLLILCVQPIGWLFNTWMDPVYGSAGGWVALLVGGLFVWSVTSPLRPSAANNKKRVISLLVLTALFRAVGQLLEVNIIGALALVVDVYAMAVLLGLNDRCRPLSPFWLAFLFAFSLPVTYLCERLLGYGLQFLSARVSQGLLSLCFDQVQLLGTQLMVNNQAVGVDLPCSGSTGLVFLLICFGVMAAFKRPSGLSGLGGLFMVFPLALMSNSLRIAILVIGTVDPAFVFDVPVMDALWHQGIGFICLLNFAVLPLVYFASRLPRDEKPKRGLPQKIPGFYQPGGSLKVRYLASGLFLLMALSIVRLPHSPCDTSQEVPELVLPAFINNEPGRELMLSAQEKAYFTRYGGQVTKKAYGSFSITAVRTSTPLRHLHNPVDCLRGLGFQTHYRGVKKSPLPSSVYEAVSPEGKRWQVAFSFVSSQGHMTANVSQVVWTWLQHPDTHWTLVERISPMSMTTGENREWEASVVAALELPVLTGESEFFSVPVLASREE